MNAPKLIVVSGGARSGKSAFALARSLALGERRSFLATAQALDPEMEERISRHQTERGSAFDTLEVPIQLPAAIDGAEGYDVLLIDCLTLWLSNLLLAVSSAPKRAWFPSEFTELLSALQRRRQHIVIVTGEVGQGLVPDNQLGRLWRDAVGEANQKLARIADELYLTALGHALRLKPAPLCVLDPDGVDADSFRTEAEDA